MWYEIWIYNPSTQLTKLLFNKCSQSIGSNTICDNSCSTMLFVTKCMHGHIHKESLISYYKGQIPNSEWKENLLPQEQ